MRKRIWKPSLVGCPSQVSFQVEPFEPFLPRARHSAFPLPPEINWLATAVGWQPQSIAGAFKSQFNFWNNICKEIWDFLNGTVVWLISVTKIPKLSTFDVDDRCDMLVLRRLQHDKIEIFIQKNGRFCHRNSIYHVSYDICHQHFCHRHPSATSMYPN